MRTIALPITVVLIVLTAYLLNQLWTIEPLKRQSTAVGTSTEDNEAAERFYRAINTYLDEGEDEALRRQLHPEFATHQTGSDWSGTDADLLDRLASIRSFFPGIQLEPEFVVLTNGSVSVALKANVRNPSEFAGFAVQPSDLFGRLDLVRIERGLVAEHWSSAPLAGQFAAYTPLSIELSVPIGTQIARIQEAPLDSTSTPMISYSSHMLLIVTSGRAFLDVTKQTTQPVMVWQQAVGMAAVPEPVDAAATVTLEPMDAVFLPAGTAFRLWDSIAATTNLIVIEFSRSISLPSSTEAPLLQALEETLWSGVSLSSEEASLTISFGQAVLLPQSTLLNPDTAGLDLAWVVGGSLEIAELGGETRVRKESGPRTQLIGGHALLTAGDAAASGPGSDVSYLNTGSTPAIAWFVSLVPSQELANQGDENGSPAPTPMPTSAPIRFHS